jgi:UDP-N-acetylmuramate--alanine ligase
MIAINSIKNIYFIGIGGIGMSALARYFNQKGVKVFGYDKTRTSLTSQLEKEGMAIHYEDALELLQKEIDLVVYTPAIPKNHKELNWYKDNGYTLYKRSDLLEAISSSLFSVTVAGTHGKTTISTMCAFLLREIGVGANAFLGGISVNYNTNYWSSDAPNAVIEADEYDRSFLKLNPSIAVLSSMDADHLDIYGTAESMEEAFIAYTSKIKKGGTLISKYGLKRAGDLIADRIITYSLNDTKADVYASDLKIENGSYRFNISSKWFQLQDVVMQIGGLHNIENAIAAFTVCYTMNLDLEKAKACFANFKGIKRRFEYIVKATDSIYIDDYAHHPAELETLIKSAKNLYPNKKCLVVFQPHLFSRTKDLVDGFAASLSLADELIILPIYPARELPMEGVTSELILSAMKVKKGAVLSKEATLRYIQDHAIELLITAGAGDIDQLIQPIKTILESK